MRVLLPTTSKRIMISSSISKPWPYLNTPNLHKFRCHLVGWHIIYPLMSMRSRQSKQIPFDKAMYKFFFSNETNIWSMANGIQNDME